jgi:hypothetical protein
MRVITTSIIALVASVPLAAAMAVPACAADACDPAKLDGAYGFQLSGHTTISGDSKPVVSVGRLVFDGHGVLSGYASVNFAGYFLGNPVTGSYEAHTDCTISWSLQDDSGAFQHFSGKLTPDNSSAEFHQSDPGGAQNGVLQKVAAQCSAAGLAPLYSFGIAGGTTPMNPGDVARQISAAGSVEPDAAGNLKITVPGGAPPTAGIITLDSDCFAQISMALPSGDTVNLRGILVNGGKQILAMQTDAGATVTAKFNVKDRTQ